MIPDQIISVGFKVLWKYTKSQYFTAWSGEIPAPLIEVWPMDSTESKEIKRRASSHLFSFILKLTSAGS